MTKTRTLVEELVGDLFQIAGIQINGSHAFDPKIHNEAFYSSVVRDGDLGLGESYVKGWWDCERVDVFIEHILRAKLQDQIKVRPGLFYKYLLSKVVNYQTKHRSLEVAKKHYDTGNDLFQAMLDPLMIYSCGYWKSAQTLEQAQLDKLDLICKKLLLSPGMRLLDIGCGWGGLARFAAEHYGVEVVGITLSKQQYELAKALSGNLPIEIRLQDYRELTGCFDRIVSVGMFEYVGHLNYKKYMEIASRCLSDDGLFLLHTIGGNQSTTQTSPWIEKNIFPNGMLPSIMQIGKAIEGVFIMEDWHNFGLDYYKTLMSWHANFNEKWDELKNNYDNTFFRMWNYYLLSCAGAFKARDIQLWQVVLSKNGLKERYEASR